MRTKEHPSGVEMNSGLAICGGGIVGVSVKMLLEVGEGGGIEFGGEAGGRGSAALKLKEAGTVLGTDPFLLGSAGAPRDGKGETGAGEDGGNAGAGVAWFDFAFDDGLAGCEVEGFFASHVIGSFRLGRCGGGSEY